MKHFILYSIITFSILLFFSPYFITLILTLKWKKNDSQIVKLLIKNRSRNYFLITGIFFFLIITGFVLGYAAFITQRGAIIDFYEEGWTGMYSFENSEKAELTAFIIPVIIFVGLLILFIKQVNITSRSAYLSIFFFIYSYILFVLAIQMSYRSDSAFIDSSKRKIQHNGE